MIVKPMEYKLFLTKKKPDIYTEYNTAIVQAQKFANYSEIHEKVIFSWKNFKKMTGIHRSRKLLRKSLRNQTRSNEMNKYSVRKSITTQIPLTVTGKKSLMKNSKIWWKKIQILRKSSKFLYDIKVTTS